MTDAEIDREIKRLQRLAMQAEMERAIRVWLECPPDKRPSPEALAQIIADIARKADGEVRHG